MAKNEVIELLKKYVLLLNSEGISVKKAFLFGSYLSDNANDESDIDVMIVSDNELDLDDALIGKAWRLTKRINSRIEPIIIGFGKFRDSDGSPLVSLVKEKGLEII